MMKARAIDIAHKDANINLHGIGGHLLLITETSTQSITIRVPGTGTLDEVAVDTTNLRNMLQVGDKGIGRLETTKKTLQLLNSSGKGCSQIPIIAGAYPTHFPWMTLPPVCILQGNHVKNMCTWIKQPTYNAVKVVSDGTIQQTWRIDNPGFGVLEEKDPIGEGEITIPLNLLSMWKDMAVEVATQAGTGVEPDKLVLTGDNMQIVAPHSRTAIPTVGPLVAQTYHPIEVNLSEFISMLNVLLPLSDKHKNKINLNIRPKGFEASAENDRDGTSGKKLINYKGSNNWDCKVNGKLLLNGLKSLPTTRIKKGMDPIMVEVALSDPGMLRLVTANDTVSMSIYIRKLKS
jgi:hypothetical protein